MTQDGKLKRYMSNKFKEDVVFYIAFIIFAAIVVLPAVFITEKIKFNKLDKDCERQGSFYLTQNPIEGLYENQFLYSSSLGGCILSQTKEVDFDYVIKDFSQKLVPNTLSLDPNIVSTPGYIFYCNEYFYYSIPSELLKKRPEKLLHHQDHLNEVVFSGWEQKFTKDECKMKFKETIDSLRFFSPDYDM
jgi:hypothetical protein